MTVVENRVYVRRRYEWVIPATVEIVFIGDLMDARSMAAAKYQEVTGTFPQIPHTEDWLRVDWDEKVLRFWFEVDGEPAASDELCSRVRSLMDALEDDRGGRRYLPEPFGTAILGELKAMLNGESA